MTCRDCDREIEYANQMEDDAVMYWYTMQEVSAIVRDLPHIRDEIWRYLVRNGARGSMLELFTPQAFRLTEEELAALDEHYREEPPITDEEVTAQAGHYAQGVTT